jgi:ABC-2 type transport system permease protein
MKKYLKIFQLAFLNKVAYRRELLISLLGGLLIFAGQAIFWINVYETREVVNGYTLGQMLIYYFIIRVVSGIVNSKMAFRVNEMILSGKVSNMILRPVSMRYWLFTREFSRLVVDVVIKMMFYVIAFMLVFNDLSFTIANLVYFVISLCFSLIISFNLSLLIGMSAFRMDNASALIYGFRRGIFFLAGGIVPLSFFPKAFQNMLNLLPFKYIIDFSINVLTGGLAAGEIFIGLAVQFFWGFVLWFLVGILLKRSLKFNESVGI